MLRRAGRLNNLGVAGTARVNDTDRAATAPAASSPAQIPITSWKASTEASSRQRVNDKGLRLDDAHDRDPIRLTMRATAFLTTDAVPASASSASASNVVVSGATDRVEPEREHEYPRQKLRQVRAMLAQPEKGSQPGGGHERPSHEDPRAEAIGKRPEAAESAT